MKIKNFILTAGLALGLGVSAFAGASAVGHKEEMKLEATTPWRFTILVQKDCYWKNDNATTWFNVWQNSYSAELELDSDFDSPYAFDGDEFYVYTGDVDLDQVTESDKVSFQRKSSDGSEDWGTIWGDDNHAVWQWNVKHKEYNIATISGSTMVSNTNIQRWTTLYWKVITHTGANNSTPTTALLANGSTIADPQDAPEGKTFSGWYIDPELETPWDASTVTGDLELYAKYVSDTGTVNKWYYYDGASAGSAGTATPEVGSYHLSEPAFPNISSKYYFAGWYWWDDREQQESPVTSIDVAKDVTYNIYAVYNKYSDHADSYVYYMASDDNTNPNYIYTYGTHNPGQFGSWPGTKVVDVPGVEEVHGVLAFDGRTRNVYKIPFSSLAGDTTVILNYYVSNGHSDNSQTGNMSLNNGWAYWFDAAGATKCGLAGAQAFEYCKAFEVKRNAVAGDGSTVGPYSICGISVGDATTLVNNYNSLSSDARAYVNNSGTFTYSSSYDFSKDPDEQAQSIISFTSMLAVLSAKSNVALVNAARINPLFGESGNTAIVTIIVISTVAVASIAGFFFIRKKKTNI